MGLESSDLELIETLKAKYKGTSSEIPLDPNAPETDANQQLALSEQTNLRAHSNSAVSSNKGGDIEAKMCVVCKGLGTCIEEYNHRRLESTCKKCLGQGVLIYKNGVEVENTSRVGSVPSTLTPAVLSEEELELFRQRVESLRALQNRAQAKVEEHQKERAALLAEKSQTQQQEKQELMQQLADQLEARMLVLNRDINKLQARIDYYATDSN